MGVLYKTAMMKKQLKKEFVLERLLEKGVTHSQEGKPIYDCDYDELKYELVLLSFREIDSQNSEGRWF